MTPKRQHNVNGETTQTLSLPTNVRVGSGTVVRGKSPFTRFFSEQDPAITIGERCLMDAVQFALGPEAQLEIGDECYFTHPVLLCEKKLVFGNRVMIGWNTNIADTDFHPLDPAQRLADAVVCSPLSDGRPRPKIVADEVIVEDDVWIGPSVTILKGVRIGAGSFIEPGAMVTRTVPPLSRVSGNPARVIEAVSEA